MKRVIAILATLGSLVVMGGTANAAGLPTTRPIGTNPAVVASVLLAQQFHGETPNCSQYGGVFAVTPAEMQAFPPTATSNGRGAAGYGWAYGGYCGIWMSTSIAQGAPNYIRLIAGCSLIAHEYGHLLGKQHSANVRSVMYPATRIRYPTRECYQVGLPAGKAAEYARYAGGSPIFLTR